jgi:hypothetical protein
MEGDLLDNIEDAVENIENPPLITGYPYVHYKNKKTTVSIDDVEIFSSEKTCIVDSIYILNTSSYPATIYLYFKQEDSRTDLLKAFTLEKGGRLEFLDKSSFYLGPQELLYAVLGDAGAVVTIIVSYRELNNQ